MKTVVVLGPCRSGSSMLAGVLSCLGVDMGDSVSLSKWKHLNKYGCYEDEDFVDLIRRIVIRAGSHLDWFSFPSEEDVLGVQPFFDMEIKRLIKSRQKDLWGWKFPWSGAVMHLLHQYLVNPFYIVLRRDSKSVARSIYNKFDDRKNFFRNVSLIFSTRAFWNPYFLFNRFLDFVLHKNDYSDFARLSRSIDSYYDLIFGFVLGKKYLVLDYDNILKSPEREINKIVNFLGIRPSEKQLSDAYDFVKPRLRNF